MRRSLFNAAPAMVRFMPFPSKGRGLRLVYVHAESGRVVLGAGPCFGAGLRRARREG